jgi:alpha 1,3-glucosidase
MWMQYPGTESLYKIDDQYLIGSDLLVKPITAPNVVDTTVKFPTDDTWYDAETLVEVSKEGEKAGVTLLSVPSDIDTIPVFQRGGSVISRKLRLRRSSHLMTSDPYTLFVALDGAQTASGVLYMDDEVSFNHESKEEFATATFSARIELASGVINNSVEKGTGWKNSGETKGNDRMIERIVVMGMKMSPSSINIGGEALGFTFDRNAKVLVIRKPAILATDDWDINISI